MNGSKGRVVAPGVRNDGALTGDAVWLFSAWRSGVLKDLGPGRSDGVRAARYVRGKRVNVVKDRRALEGTWFMRHAGN